MTYEEAIARLKRTSEFFKCGGTDEYYHIAIEALEKQIPKKPIEDTEYVGWLIWRCPICGKEVGRVLAPLQHHCECGKQLIGARCEMRLIDADAMLKRIESWNTVYKVCENLWNESRQNVGMDTRLSTIVAIDIVRRGGVDVLHKRLL